MYNSHYQGYTPPDFPTLSAVADVGQVKLSWDDVAENSTDVVTGYSDFEGYKIYRSTDGGQTWGNTSDVIYNDNGEATGWQPYAQFHLTAQEDSLHCVYDNKYHNPDLDTDGIGDNNASWPIFDCGDDNGDGNPDNNYTSYDDDVNGTVGIRFRWPLQSTCDKDQIRLMQENSRLMQELELLKTCGKYKDLKLGDQFSTVREMCKGVKKKKKKNKDILDEQEP